MSKKFRIEDIPSLEESEKKQAQMLAILAKKYENPMVVLNDKLMMTQAFLFQNHALMEQKDQQMTSYFTLKIFKFGFLTFLGSCFATISLGPVTRGRFFDLPAPTRFLIRMSIFALPLSYFAYESEKIYSRFSAYMMIKYVDRVELFMRLGDPKIMNPYHEEP